MATASSTRPGSVEQLPKELVKAMEETRGETVAEEQSAEHRACLEQLKKSTSYGNMLLKSEIMKSEGRMAEQNRALWREW